MNRSLCVLLPLLLAGCATTSDVENARREIASVNQQASARLQQIEAKLSNERLLEMVSKVDALSAEVAKLRGDNEVLAYQLGELSKRQNDLYGDLDGRLARLEGGGQPAPAASPAGQAQAADPVQQAYEQALAPLRARDFNKALTGLQGFIDANPGTEQAVEASYWLGVTHTALRHWDTAIDIHRRFVEQYPKHARAPDAMRNIANCQRELDQVDLARATLKKLIKTYPNSPAAAKAKEQLSRM